MVASVHIPLSKDEVIRLRQALRMNAAHRGALVTNPKNTEFVGYTTDAIPLEGPIATILSAPTHY